MSVNYTGRLQLLGERMNGQKLCCPEGNTRQVQLVGYLDTYPAKWKCRHCKHKFELEGGDIKEDYDIEQKYIKDFVGSLYEDDKRPIDWLDVSLEELEKLDGEMFGGDNL